MPKYKINIHTNKFDRILNEEELLTKEAYDSDENAIIDRAEILDDGVGNTATAPDTKDAITKKHTQETDKYLTTQITKTLEVDKHRTDSYIEDGSITKPFKTIQGAIDQIIANGDNSTYAYTIKIKAGEYTENIVLENTNLENVTFLGESWFSTRINPSSGYALRSIANNDNLWYLAFGNIWFLKDIKLEGTSNGTLFCISLTFDNCFSYHDITIINAVGIRMQSSVAGSLTINNVTLAQFFSCQILGTLTILGSTGGNEPFLYEYYYPGKGTWVDMVDTNPDVDFIFHPTLGNGILTIKQSVVGVNGGTIPANSYIELYNSTLKGNYTNNGSIDVYNSMFTGTITGNAPTIHIPASQIKNDSSVIGTTVKDALDTLDINSHGEMYEHNISGTTIDLDDSGTYYGWITASSGVIKSGAVSFTNDATADRLTIVNGGGGAGVYLVICNISFGGSINEIVTVTIHKNGIAQNNLDVIRKLNLNGDRGSAMISGILSLSETDYIDLRIKGTNNSKSVVLYHVNLSIKKIDN